MATLASRASPSNLRMGARFCSRAPPGESLFQLSARAPAHDTGLLLAQPTGKPAAHDDDDDDDDDDGSTRHSRRERRRLAFALGGQVLTSGSPIGRDERPRVCLLKFSSPLQRVLGICNNSAPLSVLTSRPLALGAHVHFGSTLQMPRPEARITSPRCAPPTLTDGAHR